MTMIRKQVYLEKKQDDEIKREAERLGVSEAEVIRECIDRGLSDTVALRRRVAGQKLVAELRERARLNPGGGGSYRFRHEDAYDDPLSPKTH